MAGIEAGQQLAVQALGWAGRSLLFHSGWLLHAQLGQAWGWNQWSSLAGVALWWALLALFARSGQSVRAPSRQALAALLAAAGLACAISQGPSPLGLAGWGLNLLCWSWLCASSSPWVGLPQRRLTLWCCRAAGLAGMLLAAALLTGPHWREAWPLLCALLLLAPWLNRRQDSAPSPHALDAPMGLMMATLLPMAQWCGSQGWSAPQSVVLHMSAMALGLVLAARRPPSAAGMRRAWVLSALLCLSSSPWAMLAIAFLVACASAGAAHRPCSQAQGPLATALGCSLLLAMGPLSTHWGPDALRLILVPALLLAALSRGDWLPRQPGLFRVGA